MRLLAFSFWYSTTSVVPPGDQAAGLAPPELGMCVVE